MKLSIQYKNEVGQIGLMNAVNNGPVYTKNADQNAGNLKLYTEANIPYARTHDASFFSRYGGEHTVDVHNIFRNFDADPYDPASYDFQLTDEYMEAIQMAGTQVFYRLGSKIEHESKKYGTLPPPDFHKWAVICEHIIAHMNEGWADGHHYGIEYWEIWNEPDGTYDGAPYVEHKTWGGTREQFYDLYEITAKHLKEKFPNLKIGGPALCWVNPGWMRPFLTRVKERNIPFDFFSWHSYAPHVSRMVQQCREARALLDEFGLTETESHLNEWNYVRSFCGEDWVYSLKTELSMKGGAFIAAVMSACQEESLDMLMYYDARPCGMNGMFKAYTYEPLKGYFPIKTWGEMRKLGTRCAVTCDIPDIYATAARGNEGTISMITYYTDNDDAVARTFTVQLDEERMYSLYLLDEDNDMVKVEEVYPDEGKFQLTMEPNTVVVLK